MRIWKFEATYNDKNGYESTENFSIETGDGCYAENAWDKAIIKAIRETEYRSIELIGLNLIINKEA